MDRVPDRFKQLSVRSVLTAGLTVILTVVACGKGEKSSPGNPDGSGAPGAYRREVIRRAGHYLTQEYLIVDYYRIHRKLAYPLPVARIDNPLVSVEDSFDYPWEIWMLWELEERVNSLGWAGQWTGDSCYREAACRDLEALAGWESYNAQSEPHLSVGHAARVMAAARRNWDWLPEELKAGLEKACYRLVENHSGWLKESRLGLVTADQVLAAVPPITHNIPVIATLGLCMAARTCNHPLREALEKHTLALVLAELKMREQGLTEAISYDGYVLDFVADWLEDAPEDSRRAVLDNPEVSHVLGQAALLAAPGCVWRFAPFNDVEPREMPFHAEAQAKFLRFRNDPLSAWYLRRFQLELLRADGLAALDVAGFPEAAEPRAPSPGALEALYAVVLRTGWEQNDLAVAVSASNATAGHIQRDNGTIVLGTRGRWLIDDPGYQQYLSGPEREFTLGPGAHNYPLVNGLVQTSNAVKRVFCRQEADSLWHLRLDLTGGYDPALALERVTRDVWLRGDGLVLVADRLTGRGLKDIQYTWQGCPEAAWWPRDGAWLLYADSASLWIQCPGRPLDGSELLRQPGSRGQMSIRKTFEAKGDNTLWWVFNLGENPAAGSIDSSGLRLRVEGCPTVFSLED